MQATLPRALAYARALLRDPVAAEDVVQDCYVRILGHADRYDLPRDGIKILLRSVTNACIDRRSRERALLSLDGPDFARADLADSRIANPVDAAIGNELAERIEAALQQLPLGQRAAIHLSGLGYTLPEVAEMLGISHGNARVLVHRGRKTVEEHLRPFLFGDES